MKAVLKIIISTFLICTFGSCKKVINEINLSNYMGMYSGITIDNNSFYDTYITINGDSTVDITNIIKDLDIWEFHTVKGKWSYKDSIITLKTENKDIQFKLKGNYSLSLIAKEGKKYHDIIYKKEKILNANNFVGTYYQNCAYPNSFEKILTIENVGENKVKVKIDTQKTRKKGCSFEGIGYIVNNQIEIKLNEICPELKATLVIRHQDTGKSIFVISSNFDERYDLMYFCGGGGSLIGRYLRVNNSLINKIEE